MKWATRSGPHVDRMACAWLVRRFVGPEAEFVFVDDPDEVPLRTELEPRRLEQSRAGATVIAFAVNVLTI